MGFLRLPEMVVYFAWQELHPEDMENGKIRRRVLLE